MATKIFLSAKISITCIVVLLCIAVLVRESNARPTIWLAKSGVFNQTAECLTDDDLLELCQRCAKLTKSRLAYPACCSTDLEARRWCSDFVYFGSGIHYYSKKYYNEHDLKETDRHTPAPEIHTQVPEIHTPALEILTRTPEIHTRSQKYTHPAPEIHTEFPDEYNGLPMARE